MLCIIFLSAHNKKKRKEAEAFRSAIQKGDKIVTIGGIHGKIAQVKETTIIIATEGGKMEIEKSAISANAAANEQEVVVNK